MIWIVITLHISQNQTVSLVVRMPTVLIPVAPITLIPPMKNAIHLQMTVLRTINAVPHKPAYPIPNISLNKYCFPVPQGGYCLLHSIAYLMSIQRYVGLLRRKKDYFPFLGWTPQGEGVSAPFPPPPSNTSLPPPMALQLVCTRQKLPPNCFPHLW